MAESIGETEISFTAEKRIGCGHLYLIIVFRNGTFHRILAKSGGSTDTACADATLAPLLAALTFGIRRVCTKGELIALIAGCRHNRCTKPTLADPKTRPAKSCADAVGIVLEEKLLPLWVYHQILDVPLDSAGGTSSSTEHELSGEILFPSHHPLRSKMPSDVVEPQHIPDSRVSPSPSFDPHTSSPQKLAP